MPQQHYLTPQEVSIRWNGRINVRTLANWRTQGTGPPFTKIGGAILYRAADLALWEDSNTVRSTSEYGRNGADKDP